MTMSIMLIENCFGCEVNAMTLCDTSDLRMLSPLSVTLLKQIIEIR